MSFVRKHDILIDTPPEAVFNYVCNPHSCLNGWRHRTRSKVLIAPSSKPRRFVRNGRSGAA
jgi:hypothetical protein